MALTSIDINHFVQPFKKSNIFKGVFASDRLPSKFTLPAAFVINLSTHNSRGTHWVALYIKKTDTVNILTVSDSHQWRSTYYYL